MAKTKVRRIDENGNSVDFNTLMDAARSVDSKLETWKVAIYIAGVLNRKGKAFKYNWERIEKQR